MAIVKTVKIKVDTGSSVSELKNLEKGVDKVGDEAKQTQASMATLTGGAGARFKGLITSIQGVALGFKSLKFAIAASGIGLVLLAIVSITAAFKNSEAGQNKFAKLMGVIGSVVGNVVDVVADLGNFIIDLFSGDGEAMRKLKAFGKSIFDVVGLPLKNVIDTVKTLGKVLGALFSGDIDKAFEELNDGVSAIKENFTEAKDAINGAKDALFEFGQEALKEAKIASDIADQRAKADKIERGLIVERAKANQKIADLRFKAEQRDKFSASERVKFLKEAGAIEDAITSKEIAAAKLRLNAQIEENKLSGSKKDDLDKVAQLQATLINLDTSRLNLQKRLATSIITFQREEQAAINKTANEKKKALETEEKDAEKKREEELKVELKRLEDIEKIRSDFRLQLEDAEVENELQKIALEEERVLAELDRLKATEAQKAEVRKFYAQKTATEEERITREANAKKISDEEKIKNAKIQLASTTLSIIGNLAKEGSELAKGVAASQALISTYQGVMSALSAQTVIPEPMGQILKVANAVAVGVAGAVNVKKILSTKPVTTSAPSGGGQTAPPAPSFNLVEGTADSQLSNDITSANNNPVNAFVVSSDVTTAQELDRNIINESGI